MSSAGRLWRRWVWRNIVGGIVGFIVMIVLAAVVFAAGYFSGLIAFDPERIQEIRLGTVQIASIFLSLPLVFFVAKFQIPVFKERLGYFSGTRWIVVNIVFFVILGLVGLVELMVMFPGGASIPLSAAETLNLELTFSYNLIRSVVFGAIVFGAIWYFSLNRYATGFWPWMGWGLASLVLVVVVSNVSTLYLLPLSPSLVPLTVGLVNILILIGFIGIGVVKLRSRGLPDEARAEVAKTFA